MAKLEPHAGDYYLWKYVPSIPAAVIFFLLFVCTTAFHSWKIWKTRARFCIPFAIGGLFEIIGYIGRIDAHGKTGKLGPYIIQSVFILLGPVLFAASVYMVLGRLIRSIQAEKHSVIRVNWLTKIFVASDVLSFLVQGSGAGLMASGSSANMGNNIVIAGLVIQVLMFGLFMVTSFEFERRMNRAPSGHVFDADVPWKTHLHVLDAVSALILIRSVFRVIEYAGGQDGYLLGHEWTMYVFDSVPMVTAMALWAVWHPGVIQSSATRTRTHTQALDMMMG
ncbi:protein RTM1 [Aspergillus udagawae]|uniref:Protein RTM1 n=1 Tax=Aspergillus udagawae TaxID=91492 RepID=A0A8H3RHV0_9EURO|nr:protein RTM1 [Aspergillus udagawae]